MNTTTQAVADAIAYYQPVMISKGIRADVLASMVRLDRKGQGKPCGKGWISARKNCSKKGAQQLAADLKAGDKKAIARVKRGKQLAAGRQIANREADHGAAKRQRLRATRELKSLKDEYAAVIRKTAKSDEERQQRRERRQELEQQIEQSRLKVKGLIDREMMLKGRATELKKPPTNTQPEPSAGFKPKLARSTTEAGIMRRFAGSNRPEAAVIQQGFDRIDPEFWDAAKSFDVQKYAELETKVQTLQRDRAVQDAASARRRTLPAYIKLDKEVNQLADFRREKRREYERAERRVDFDRKTRSTGEGADRRRQEMEAARKVAIAAQKKFENAAKRQAQMNDALYAQALGQDPQIMAAREEMQGMAQAGEKMRQKLIESSPISRKQAEAIAKKIKKPSGYRTKDPALMERISDFMQITGGMGQSSLKRINISRRRAHATPSGLATYNGPESHSVLFHEMGHHAEFESPETLGTMKSWVDGRASGPPQPLRKLTQSNNYRRNETAVPDAFVSPYVGKLYDGASEAFSMGIEHFVDPGKMMKLAARDPEHFALMIGALKR